MSVRCYRRKNSSEGSVRRDVFLIGRRHEGVVTGTFRGHHEPYKTRETDVRTGGGVIGLRSVEFTRSRRVE